MNLRLIVAVGELLGASSEARRQLQLQGALVVPRRKRGITERLPRGQAMAMKSDVVIEETNKNQSTVDNSHPAAIEHPLDDETLDVYPIKLWPLVDTRELVNQL